MAQKVRAEVDKDLWDDTPWLGVGFLLEGAFACAAGVVRSPYVGVPTFHHYWDVGWTMAAKGKIKLGMVNDDR